MTDPSERRWMLAGWAAAAPVLLAPIGDPDLWWHLSSARWMLENLAWPRTDILAATSSGRAWSDFEWLSQLFFHAAGSIGGVGGLWALKAALMGVVGAGVFRALRHAGAPPPARAFGLALWAAAMVSRADIRTELFSLALFAWLLCSLERKGRVRMPPAAALLIFAAWANLHAGFVYGLLLLGAYAYKDYRRGGNSGLTACLCAGAAGTLLNPYGWGIYRVIFRHMREVGDLARYIDEWGWLTPEKCAHWPVWFLIIALAALLARRMLRRAEIPPVPAVLSAVFAAAALRHARLAPYLAACAAVYAVRLAVKDVFLLNALKDARAAAVGMALCFIFSFRCTGLSLDFFQDAYTPVCAAAFLERQPGFSGLRFYSLWGWGGYLGYRLGDRVRLFQDGRYIFHPLLIEGGRAAERPEAWQGFLKKHHIEAAVLQNAPVKMETTRTYPDGSRKKFLRPYYVQFMPKERWPLVYWDDKALIFVRRDILDGRDLSELEYRLLRPGDETAREDALARGEIDPDRLRRELDRHRREAADLPRRPAFR